MKRALENYNEKKNYGSEFNRIPLKVNILNEVKTKVILLAILSLGIIFTSCVKDDFDVVPSTKVTTTDFSASGISQLEVSNVFKVYVSFSETEESVQVEASANVHSLIEMSQVGNKLIVDLHKNTTFPSGAPVLNVYIKTATLSKVKATGTAFVEFENLLDRSQLDLEITGAAAVSGSIEVDDLLAQLTGAAKLDISGNSNSFDIDAEGASEMTGFDFATNTLKTDLKGGSNISLVVNQKMEVSARGGSKVRYKGNGIIDKQYLSDASQIVNMN